MAPNNSDRSGRFYLPQLDGLRFLAFLLVFLHHAPLAFDNLVAAKIHSFGWVGVELFFVLSAFLMTSLLLREHDRFGRISVGRFYLRRVLRIWPLYFFALFVGFLLIPVVTWGFSGSSAYQQLIQNYLLPYLTFFANVPVAVLGYPTSSFPALAHLWTISFEEQFYVVLPLLIICLAPLGPKLWLRSLVLVFVLGLAIRTSLRLMHVHNLAAWVIPLARPDSFLIGIAIALSMERYNLLGRVPRKVQLALPLLAILLLVLIVSYPNIDEESNHSIWQYTAISLGMGALLISVLRERSWLAAGLKTAPLKYLGKVSYGLYVYHVLAIKIAHHLAKPLSSANLGVSGTQAMTIEISMAFILTVVVSAFSYRWLEKPFLDWKAKFEAIKSRHT